MAADPVAVAPHVYKVVFENDRVRVLDARGNPGDKTDFQGHPDLVAIGVTACQLKLQFPDGQTAEAELKPNEVLYLQAQEHAVGIMGTGETRLLIIELNRAEETRAALAWRCRVCEPGRLAGLGNRG